MMKTRSFLAAVIIVLFGNVLFAQEAEVNTKKSNIKWIGEKIGSQHEGNIKLKSGHLEFDKDKIVAGSFVVDMTTITNTDIDDEDYSQKLVGHLKSEDFFGVEEFPAATFVLTRSSVFEGGKATLSGEITIKGTTEPISFEVERKGNKYTTNVEIDRSKFNVKYGSDSFFDNLGDKVIDDMFTIVIDLMVNK